MRVRLCHVSMAGFLISVAMPLTACTGGVANPQIPPPGSPVFQQSYLDGCSSGFKDAGRDGYEEDYRKDTASYAHEPDYKQGWDEGHAACFEEEKRHPKVLGAGGGSAMH